MHTLFCIILFCFLLFVHYSWKTCIRFTQMPRALVFRGKAEWYGLLGKVFPFLWECCRCVYWRSRWLLGMSHPRCFCGVYETSILSVYSVCNCGVGFVRPSPGYVSHAA